MLTEPLSRSQLIRSTNQSLRGPVQTNPNHCSDIRKSNPNSVKDMSKNSFGFEEKCLYYNLIQIRKTCLEISSGYYVSSFELGYQVLDMSSFNSDPNLELTQFVRISPEIFRIPLFLSDIQTLVRVCLDGTPNYIETYKSACASQLYKPHTKILIGISWVAHNTGTAGLLQAEVALQ